MSALPSRPAPSDDPGQPGTDTHAFRHVLADLIAIGADFARLLHAQAKAQPAPAQPGAAAQPAPALELSAPDTLITLAAAFDQIARAIRRSITLARSLDRPLPSAPNPAPIRTAARKRIIREVEDRIERTADTDDFDTSHNAADLHAELRDRLDAPDLDDDLATRPVAEIITEICRDLGLASPPGDTPWRRRTPADLADLCARAAAPAPIRQSGIGSPPGRHATQRRPDVQSDTLPIAACARPSPIHAAHGPSDKPACSVAVPPTYPASDDARWRPPRG